MSATKQDSGCSSGFIATIKRIFGRGKKEPVPEGRDQAAPIARSNKERKALEDANLGLPQGNLVPRDIGATMIGLYGVPNSITRAFFDTHSRCCVLVGDDGTFDVFGVNGSQAHGEFDVPGIVPIGVFYGGKTVIIVTDHHARFYHPVVTQNKPGEQEEPPAPEASKVALRPRNDITHIKTYAETPFKIPLRSCDFLCGEEYAIVGDDDGTLYGISLITGELSKKTVTYEQVIAPRIPTDKSNPLLICRMNPLCPAAVLLYHSRDKLLHGWDLANNRKIHRYHIETLDHISAIQWHHKGDRFFTAHHNGYVCLWKVRDNKECLWQFPMVVVPNPDDSVVRISKICVAKQDEDKYLFLTVGGNVCEKGDINGDRTPPAILIAKGALRSKTMERYTLQQDGTDATFLFESNQRANHRDPYAVMATNNEDGSLQFHTPRAPFNTFTVKTISLVFSQCPLSCYACCCGINLSFLSGGGGWGNAGPNGSLLPTASSVGLNTTPRRSGESLKHTDIVFTGHEDGSIFLWDVTQPGMRHMLTAHAPVDAPVSSILIVPSKHTMVATVADRGIYLMQFSDRAEKRRVSKYNMVHFGSGDLSLSSAVVQAAVETKTAPKIDVVEPTQTCLDAEPGFQTFAQIDLPEFGTIAVSSGIVLAVALKPNVVAIFEILKNKMHFEFVGNPDHSVTSMRFYECEDSEPLLFIGCSDGSLWLVSVNHDSVPMQCLSKKGWSSVVDIIIREELCPVVTEEMKEKAGEAKAKQKSEPSDDDEAPSTPKGVASETSILTTTTTTTTTKATATLIDADEDSKDDAGSNKGERDDSVDYKPRTLLLLCMETGVITMELTSEGGALKAREAFVSLKYKLNFHSFAVVKSALERGVYLAAVDPTLQCVAWNLYQLTEIRALNLASLMRVKDPKRNVRASIVSNGCVYALQGHRRLGVCSLQPGVAQHTLQYAEDVAETNTQEPAKLRLTQRWTTLGLPLGQSLKSLF